MKPTFIGIGAQKCASTWLYDILADHPEVGLSPNKEVDFFSYHYDHGYQWYERNFEQCQGRRAVGEISPSYFHEPAVAHRVYDYSPDLRIVLSLRDPVARAISNHKHEVRVGHITGPDFSFEAGLINNPAYVEQGRYATHLSRWLEYFPREQILIVLMDDIIADPRGVARTVYEFLGVGSRHASLALQERSNESYVNRSRRLAGVVDRSRSVIEKVGLGFLWRGVAGSGLRALYRKYNRQPSSAVILPPKPETRQRLHQEFTDEIDQLQRMLGRSLAQWR